MKSFPSINTRKQYENVTNRIAKREPRGSKTLWQVQGSALLGFKGQSPSSPPLRNPSSCAMIHL